MEISERLRNLGQSDLRVSRIGLGTYNFGSNIPEAECYRLLDISTDSGINLIDTANVYGWCRFRGTTEQLIGRWLAQSGGKRERIVLCTKVYGPMGNWPNTSGLSALHIRRACDESLRRLQTDYIDLYQIHHVWRDGSWQEIWQAMDVLVRQGKVRYVGSSNLAGWNVAQANEVARNYGTAGLVSEQSIYNLSCRAIEQEVVEACRHYQMGLLCWSPLGGGMLAGPTQAPERGRRSTQATQARIKNHQDKLDVWLDLCAGIQEKPYTVALAWVLQNPVVTSAIIGPRTCEQLGNLLTTVDITLSKEVTEALDDIFPPQASGREPDISTHFDR